MKKISKFLLNLVGVFTSSMNVYSPVGGSVGTTDISSKDGVNDKIIEQKIEEYKVLIEKLTQRFPDAFKEQAKERIKNRIKSTQMTEFDEATLEKYGGEKNLLNLLMEFSKNENSSKKANDIKKVGQFFNKIKEFLGEIEKEGVRKEEVKNKIKEFQKKTFDYNNSSEGWKSIYNELDTLVDEILKPLQIENLSQKTNTTLNELLNRVKILRLECFYCLSKKEAESISPWLIENQVAYLIRRLIDSELNVNNDLVTEEKDGRRQNLASHALDSSVLSVLPPDTNPSLNEEEKRLVGTQVQGRDLGNRRNVADQTTHQSSVLSVLPPDTNPSLNEEEKRLVGTQVQGRDLGNRRNVADQTTHQSSVLSVLPPDTNPSLNEEEKRLVGTQVQGRDLGNRRNVVDQTTHQSSVLSVLPPDTNPSLNEEEKRLVGTQVQGRDLGNRRNVADQTTHQSSVLSVLPPDTNPSLNEEEKRLVGTQVQGRDLGNRRNVADQTTHQSSVLSVLPPDTNPSLNEEEKRLVGTQVQGRDLGNRRNNENTGAENVNLQSQVEGQVFNSAYPPNRQNLNANGINPNNSTEATSSEVNLVSAGNSQYLQNFGARRNDTLNYREDENSVAAMQRHSQTSKLRESLVRQTAVMSHIENSRMIQDSNRRAKSLGNQIEIDHFKSLPVPETVRISVWDYPQMTILLEKRFGGKVSALTYANSSVNLSHQIVGVAGFFLLDPYFGMGFGAGYLHNVSRYHLGITVPFMLEFYTKLYLLISANIVWNLKDKYDRRVIIFVSICKSAKNNEKYNFALGTGAQYYLQ